MTPSLVIAVDCRPLIEKRVSGVSVYTREIIRELSKYTELDLKFFYQNGKKIEHLHQEFKDIQFIKKSSTKFHLRSSIKFQKLAEGYFDIKPDLIWLPDRRPFYKTEIPIVMTIHDMVPKRARASLSWRSRLWHLMFPTKKLIKNVDGVLCPSFSVEQEIPRNMMRRVTYEGARKQKPELIKGLSKKFSLFLAPDDPRKGISDFLRLVQDFPKDNFVWAGRKPNDKRFSSLKVDELTNLHIIPEFSESQKWGLFQQATLLLALSKYEGFDLPVLEAVRAKCPVIMSDIDVHQELYSGVNFVSNYEDLKTEYIRSRSNRLALPKTRGVYTWGSAAKQSLLLFRRVIENKN